MSSSLREFRVAKTYAPRLGGLEGRRSPRTDYFALVLGDRGQDVDGQLVLEAPLSVPLSVTAERARCAAHSAPTIRQDAGPDLSEPSENRTGALCQ